MGTLLTIYLCSEYRLTIDYILLAVYALIWTLDIMSLIKHKTYGEIKDESGNPIDMVLIRVIDAAGKIRGTVISGADGRFAIALPRGEYSFDIAKTGYTHLRTKLMKISKPSDLGKINIKLRKISQAKQEQA
jgi:hypothetical protein